MWFLSLDTAAVSKVQVAVARLELGNLSRVAWFRGIGEVRIDWGPGLPIYLAPDDPTLLLLLGGGSKRRQHGTSRPPSRGGRTTVAEGREGSMEHDAVARLP